MSQRLVRWARRLLLLSLISVLALPWVYAYLNWSLDAAYLENRAVHDLIGYLDRHPDRWPQSWLELVSDSGQPVDQQWIEQLESRIYLDFSVDPEELSREAIASEAVTFDVVHARWSVIHFDRGPNAVLRRFFRERAGIFDAPEPAGGWWSRADRELADRWFARGINVQLNRESEVTAVWTDMLHKKLGSGPEEADQIVADLAGLPHLRAINLVGCPVTDRAMHSLKTMNGLETLEIDSALVTDEGLRQLAGHPSLRSLSLFGTNVTETGILSLQSIPCLKWLSFDPDRISRTTFERLQTKLPGLVEKPAELRVQPSYLE